MAKYIIHYGLGGGFGGATEQEIIDVNDLQEAEKKAHEAACEYYDMYDGLYGLRSIEQIMDEDKVDEDEAKEIWEEDRESWLDYRAESA